MSACPLGGINGFVNLTGPPSPTALSNSPPLVNGTPLLINFAPRTTPPSIVGNLIQGEGTDTLLYKGATYTLLTAQINAVSHNGYTSTPPQCELSLTFSNPQAIGTYPSVILLIVPIMLGNSDVRMTYFQSLLNQDSTQALTNISLETIFTDNSINTMVSYGYKPCINLANPTTNEITGSLNLYVLYFSNGIVMTQSEFNVFNQSVTIQQGFELPSQVLGGMATVLTTTTDSNGDLVPLTTSTAGQIGTSQLSASTNDFLNMFQYFAQSPGVSTTPTSPSSPAYTTTQYKCLPFNKFRDLSANLVGPASVVLQNKIADVQGPPIQLFSGGSAGVNGWSIILDILLVVLGIAFISTFVYIFFGGEQLRTAVAVTVAVRAATQATTQATTQAATQAAV